MGFDSVAAGWTLFGVLWEQKISDLRGGFTGVLEDGDDFGTSVAALGDLDGALAAGALLDDDGCSAECRVEVCGDLLLIREFLADAVGMMLSLAAKRRCTVIGEAGPCGILNVVVIRRDIAGYSRSIDQVCTAMSVS